MDGHMATKTDPARVKGSERAAIAYFIEDGRGDLVDIEYVCSECYGAEVFDYLRWPGFDFGDQAIHCHECGDLIHAPADYLREIGPGLESA